MRARFNPGGLCFFVDLGNFKNTRRDAPESIRDCDMSLIMYFEKGDRNMSSAVGLFRVRRAVFSRRCHMSKYTRTSPHDYLCLWS